MENKYIRVEADKVLGGGFRDATRRRMIVRDLSICFCCEEMRDYFGAGGLVDVDPLGKQVIIEKKNDAVIVRYCPFCGAEVMVDIHEYWRKDPMPAEKAA